MKNNIKCGYGPSMKCFNDLYWITVKFTLWNASSQHFDNRLQIVMKSIKKFRCVVAQDKFHLFLLHQFPWFFSVWFLDTKKIRREWSWNIEYDNVENEHRKSNIIRNTYLSKMVKTNLEQMAKLDSWAIATPPTKSGVVS